MLSFHLAHSQVSVHPEMHNSAFTIYSMSTGVAFASRDEYFLQAHIAGCEQDSTLGQDALTNSWSQPLLYDFPSLLLTFHKIQQLGYTVLLMVPRWQA